MAKRPEIAATYAAAVVQGIVLVTYPAISSVLTDGSEFGLSNAEYGSLFVPQAVLAIVSSLSAAFLAVYQGEKRVLLWGLLADLLSMVLLVSSSLDKQNHSFTYLLLLGATACLGVGFGFVVPALNTLTAAFFPDKIDRAILTLNALLGLGTALAPLFATLFVGAGVWWALPTLMVGASATLVFAVLWLPFHKPVSPLATKTSGSTSMRETTSLNLNWSRTSIYALFALLYGICETLYGNWVSVYLHSELASPLLVSSLALAFFWVSVTGGRLIFALNEKRFPSQVTLVLLPAVLAGAFLATGMTQSHRAWLGVISAGLGGLGCSALLPLVISFGQKEFSSVSSSVAGALIGFYQMGYGVSAFGVSLVQSWAQLSLAAIFGWSSLLALVLFSIALTITRGGRNWREMRRSSSAARS